MFLLSSDASKVSFPGNGEMTSPSRFDETAVKLSLSFRELKESLCIVEAFPGSSFFLAVIRELPPRDGTEEETPLANEASLSLDKDDEFSLIVREDSPWTVKEELLLAVDKKSSLLDKEMSPLSDDDKSSLTDNEDFPFANEVESSLADENGVDEQSLLDADVESLSLGEVEFLFIHEGGVPLDVEEGSPLVGEEESFLDADVEPFFPGGEGAPLTDGREFLLVDERGLLLDDEGVFSLGSAMCLVLDVVPSFTE